jgi:hypothetical protein
MFVLLMRLIVTFTLLDRVAAEFFGKSCEDIIREFGMIYITLSLGCNIRVER